MGDITVVSCGFPDSVDINSTAGMWGLHRNTVLMETV